MEAMRSSAGRAEGFKAADPLLKNPNSRKLMTKPSVSRCRAIVCKEISCCKDCIGVGGGWFREADAGRGYVRAAGRSMSGRARAKAVWAVADGQEVKVGVPRAAKSRKASQNFLRDHSGEPNKNSTEKEFHMPIGILNNIASLAAENQLTITNNNLQNVLLELSSGSRINSGADDAAGLAIANGLQANISALLPERNQHGIRQ